MITLIMTCFHIKQQWH